MLSSRSSCIIRKEKLKRGSAIHMFSTVSFRSESRNSDQTSVIVSSSRLHSSRRERLTVSPRTSCFPSAAVSRLKRPRHTSPGRALASCVARNYTLAFFPTRGRPYLRIQSREYALALLETLSSLPSRFNPFSCQAHPSEFFFPHLFHPSPAEATARTFPRPATTLREKRDIYIPVVKLLEAPTLRSNTEYHWRTLISFCRSQTVSMRPNFRVSSRALDCAFIELSSNPS